MMLSVVIPTHLRPDSLLRLLSSIEMQTFDKKQLEVLVVANLESRDLRRRIRKYARTINCTMLVSGKLGVNYARHLGAKHSLGDLVCFLDDDCRLQDSNYLTKISQLHDDLPDAAAIGGPYLLPPGSPAVAATYHKIVLSWLENSVTDNPPWTHNLVGGNACYKKSVFTRGLNFNAKIRFGGAETDLHMRMLKSGLKLAYSTTIPVEHWTEVSIYQFVRKAFLQGVGFERRSQKGIQVSIATRSNPPHTLDWHPAELKFAHLYEYAFRKGRLWAQANQRRTPKLKIWRDFFRYGLQQDLKIFAKKMNRFNFISGTASK